MRVLHIDYMLGTVKAPTVMDALTGIDAVVRDGITQGYMPVGSMTMVQEGGEYWAVQSMLKSIQQEGPQVILPGSAH